MACDLLFLQQYAILSHEFLERIVTGDETRVHYHAPETNRASMEWKHPGSPRTKKFEMVKSAGKLMATVFWDHKDVLLVEFMKKGTTINAASYCATLERLKTAIKRKRPGILTKGVILHDNARPHVATATQELF
jgi:histone-lysine N-methyltransferase SETMAR